MHHHLHRLAPALALCLPLLAVAQDRRSDPADPRAPAPALRYSSAFADYKPWQDIKPADWRAVNDQLRGAAGGAAHAGHAGPAPAAATGPQPAAKPSPPATSGAHGGHGGHSGHSGQHSPGSKP